MQGLLQNDHILVHEASKSAFGFHSISTLSTVFNILDFGFRNQALPSGT